MKSFNFDYKLEYGRRNGYLTKQQSGPKILIRKTSFSPDEVFI